MSTHSQKTIERFLALQRSEEKFRILFERSPIGMVLVENATGKILEVNDAALRPSGYSKEELLAFTFWDIIPQEVITQEIFNKEEVKKNATFGPIEKEYIHKNGSLYPIKIRGFLLTDFEKRDVVWLLIEDIRKQKEIEQAMRHMAFHDPLTGLPNRRLLSDRIQQALIRALRNGIQGALLICDLDLFKPVNDKYGHEIGDDLLKEVAGRISNNVLHRESDTISRIGGDEFAILLPEITSHSGLEYIARNIISELTRPFQIKGHNIQIGCSIGVAIFPDHGSKELDIMRTADAAMYAAKTEGGNTWAFAESTPS